MKTRKKVIKGWGHNNGECSKEERKRFNQRKLNILSDSQGLWVMEVLEHLLRLHSHYTHEQLDYFYDTMTHFKKHRTYKFSTVKYIQS